MDALGVKIRRQRRRMGFTLDDLAGRTGISKPYLSLIETGRVTNPPADEKLRRLEQTLGFGANELISQAHLQRTPRDVREMLHKLLADSRAGGGSRRGDNETMRQSDNGMGRTVGGDANGGCDGAGANGGTGDGDGGHGAASGGALARGGKNGAQLKPGVAGSINLDDAYLSGVLQRMVEQSSPNVERVTTNSVPVINKVSAGYPRDFTDLAYPRGIADEYVGCPDLADRDAFAARVHGDSMKPKYGEGDIVIFSPSAACKSGDDCFVRFEDGQTTFKRVFFEKDGEGEEVLRLQPRNESYPPKVVRREELGGLYKAVYRYQRVDEED